MKNIYTFENMDGKVTTITSSHELSQSAVDAFMDSFGLSYNHAVEPFDRVEQTYKQVAEQLQVELNAITARADSLQDTMADISSACIGEIAMGYTLDAMSIGESIYQATGMTNEELTKAAALREGKV